MTKQLFKQFTNRFITIYSFFSSFYLYSILLLCFYYLLPMKYILFSFNICYVSIINLGIVFFVCVHTVLIVNYYCNNLQLNI